MSLPTIEPILPDEPEQLSPARQRRRRRALVPPDKKDRSGFLVELSERVVPSFDFFLFSLLAGIVLAVSFYFDSPALVFLSALLAPFMAPVLGASLGAITGAPRFWLQSLVGLFVGGLMVFLCSLLAGWVAALQPTQAVLQAAAHSRFTWAGFLVMVLGAGLTTYLIVRSPHQKPLVTSVAIAYSLYLPVGAAGFGLGSGTQGLWPGGLSLFAIHLVWAILISILVLAILGLRPLSAAGYLLAVVSLALAVLTVPFLQAAGSFAAPTSQQAVVTGQMSTPEPTEPALLPEQFTPTPSVTSTATQVTPTITPQPPTPTITPTNTLVPTSTPTITITTAPTPVWARVNAPEGNGILIRQEPSFTAGLVQSLLNGTMVEVLPEVFSQDNVTWVKIRTVDGKEGWVVRSLLATATPAPNW